MPTASLSPHLDAFLAAAVHFLGIESLDSELGRELLDYAGFPGFNGAWCAVFVMGCAGKAGILNEVIARDPYAYAIEVQRLTVDDCGGTWIEGPAVNGGVAVTPMPGDLITFGWTSYYTGYEHASHIGIVESVSDGQVHTIEGNTSGTSARRSYDLAYDCINMYVRPDWSRVGDSVSSGGILGPLYKTRNDRHDMTIRQVGYLNNNYALSDVVSPIGISVINYTSLLGDLYELFAPTLQNRVVVDTSHLQGNEKISVDFFLSKGYSASAASAITGCLKKYSKIQTSFSLDLGMVNNIIQRLQGIAAWNNEKFQWVKDRLGYDNRYDLTGQLQCLADELDLEFKSLVQQIKYKPLDIVSINQAVTLFIHEYNAYFDNPKSVEDAKEYAVEIYNKLIITQNSVIGNVDNLQDESGNILNAMYSVLIPTDLDQTGIIDDYTSYSHYYHIWSAGTVQRALADTWAYQGFPHDKGVALIGGYYCVAVRPKFGDVGDVIVVTLEDDISFSAIICDEKGEDAGSEWGHVKGNGVSIIEWERIVTYNGEVQTDYPGATMVDALGFDDWLGKEVVSITNYGQYLT